MTSYFQDGGHDIILRSAATWWVSTKRLQQRMPVP